MDNWEKNIKEKLEAREITPAAGSWDQLSKELASAEAKKPSKKWWWGIAASFLIGILVASFFFTLGKGSEVKITETKPEKIENNQEIPQKENLLFEELEGEKVYTADKIEQVFPKEELLKNEKPVKAIAENHLSKTEETKTTKVLIAENNEGTQNPLPAKNIEEEVDDLLAAAQKQLKKEAVVTGNKLDNEVENLINNARLSLEDEELATHQVDDQQLLEEAENATEDTFREKVYDNIEKGWSYLKNSVANTINP